MKWIALPLLLFLLCSTVAAGECPAPGSVVEFFGTISKDLSISMNLTFQNDRLSGSYAYVKYKKKIPLSGACTGGSLTLRESDASGKPTGTFRGSYKKPQIVEGTWSTPDGKKSLPFRLQALLPTDRVSGKYRTRAWMGKEVASTGAELNVLLLDDGQLRIQGDAIFVANVETGAANTGEVNGTAKLEGNKAYFADVDNDCRLTILFTNRTLTVTDDSKVGCWGAGVTFGGAYQRVAPPTFFEETIR